MHKKAPVILYIRLNYSAYMHIFEKTRINNPSKKHIMGFFTKYSIILPYFSNNKRFLSKIQHFRRINNCFSNHYYLFIKKTSKIYIFTL